MRIYTYVFIYTYVSIYIYIYIYMNEYLYVSVILLMPVYFGLNYKWFLFLVEYNLFINDLTINYFKINCMSAIILNRPPLTIYPITC